MDLTTRCPQCGSTFPVGLEQLQLRKGFIRCVKCAHIFDAYEAVVPGEAEAVAPPVPSVVRQRPIPGDAPDFARPVSARPAPVRSEPAHPTFTISSSEPAAAPANTRGRVDPVLRTRSGADVNPGGAETQQSAAAPRIFIDPRPAATEAPAQSLPEFLEERRARRTGFIRLFWAVLILIGTASLLAQLVYVYRVQIASEIPAARPALEQACATLKCTVAYPRRIQLISIMNSSLQADVKPADAAPDSDKLTLRVTLRNNYDRPQQWPVLTLDLVDHAGSVVAKKNLLPKDYLSPALLQGPFAAKSEVVLAVPITIAGVKINGYQLGKFFP